ncbi:mycothiol transferase [Streptomyces albidoflavus]|uniref:mycothiol transferase n=1 Tax=Streptomyces albidoflavus TaxID=1886 RepID=UPI00369E28A1
MANARCWRLFRDFQRGVVRRKGTELTEEQARRRHAPSSTTAAGLLKHLALVEHNWFVRVLGQPPSVLPGPEISFAVGEEETVAGLITAYEAACARHGRARPGTRSIMWCHTSGRARPRPGDALGPTAACTGGVLGASVWLPEGEGRVRAGPAGGVRGVAGGGAGSAHGVGGSQGRRRAARRG